MPLWGRDDTTPNTAPKEPRIAPSVTARGNTAFGNVTVGAFVSKEAVGMFGVDTTEAQVSNSVTHAGWVRVTQWTGPVSGLSITAAGTGYSNTDLIKVSGGTSNAAGTLVTNSTGGITSVVLTGGGAGFKSVGTGTSAVTNATGGASGGSNAVIGFTLGGRAGRVFMETIVAMGSISGDASDDSIFPDS